jgi:centractin
MDLAGREVTGHLQNLLRKSGINFNTSAEVELVRTIKEKYCAISLNPLEKAREKKEKYTLPDGQTVEFSNNEK